MENRYEQDSASKNTPHLRKRKLLFLTAMGIFVLNLILSGVFITSNTLLFIIVAVVFWVFTIIQYLDNRKDMWTWGYVLSWIAFAFIASAVIFLSYKAYWWLIAYAIELALFVFLYKKTIKRIKRKPGEPAQE